MRIPARLRLPALALGLTALWGCFSDKAADPLSSDTVDELQRKGSLSGTVTDSVGHGISGVAVTLDSGGYATNTDSLGRYTIPDVPGRTWTLRFTKANWMDTSLPSVVLAIDEDRKGLDMRMRPVPVVDTTGSFAGTVTDTAGKPILGASIQVVGATGLTTLSDSAGRFLLTKVPAGTWGLSFSKVGYVDTSSFKLVLDRKEAKTGIVARMRPEPVVDTTGSFAGTVTDTSGKPILGASIQVAGATGLTTLSDSSGKFLLTKVQAGSWSLSFSRSGYADTALAGLTLAGKEAKTGIVARMRPHVDTLVAVDTVRQILGTLANPARVARLEVTEVSGTGTAVPVTSLSWLPSGAWTAQLRSVRDSGTLKMIARDSAGHATGYGSYAFKAAKTLLVVPTFDALNALPKVEAGNDNLVPVGRTHLLKAQARDTLDNADIVSIEWSCGNATSWSPEGSNGYTLALPQDSGALVCRVRAVDKDGNLVQDSLTLHVVNSAAKINGFPDTTIYTSTVALSLQATDTNGVAKVRWSFGDGTSDSTLGATSTVKHTYAGSFATSRQPFPVTATVVDSQGGTTPYSRKVTFENPEATLSGFDIMTIYTNTVNLSLTANDPNGVTKVRWNFGDNTTDSTLGANSAVKHTYAGSFPKDSILTVTAEILDSMGGTTSVKRPLTIANPKATTTGFENKTIYTNTVDLALVATDLNGVAKVRWNFGDNTTDSTLGANSTVKHTFAGTFPTTKAISVTATVVDSLGGTTSSPKFITIGNPAASVIATTDTTTITPSDSVTFTATILDSNGISRVLWVFTDGQIDTSYASGSVTHGRRFPGTGVIPADTKKSIFLSVVVQDSLGGSTSVAIGSKTISNDIPTVTVNDTVGEVGTSMTLHAVGKDLGKITYEWSLDGTTFKAGAKDTTITLPATPTMNYPVFVRVKDEDGNVSKVDTIKIIVNFFLVDNRDGKRYRTALIGSQLWMAENLDYKMKNSYCYDDDIANCTKYGSLYTWASAMNLNDTCNTKSCISQMQQQGICPSGWHIPNKAEWTKLTDTTLKTSNSATKLKSITEWSSNNGTDIFGFSALPAGDRHDDGLYLYKGTSGYFLTTAEDDYSSADTQIQYFNVGYTMVLTASFPKAYAYSLRCLKD